MPQSFQLILARIVRIACLAGVPSALAMDMTPVELAAIGDEYMEERIAEHEAANYRTAALMAMQANCHRKKASRPLKPEDFLPKRDQTPEEMFATLALAMGAN